MIKLLFLLLFIGTWTATTFNVRADRRVDPDLGVSTSHLTLHDAMLWALPLTLFIWLVFICAFFLLRLIVNVWRAR